MTQLSLRPLQVETLGVTSTLFLAEELSTTATSATFTAVVPANCKTVALISIVNDHYFHWAAAPNASATPTSSVLVRDIEDKQYYRVNPGETIAVRTVSSTGTARVEFYAGI